MNLKVSVSPLMVACPCGGVISASTKPGRTFECKHGVEVPIPDDFLTPVCNNCGDEFMTEEVAAKLAGMLKSSCNVMNQA